ncbi:MAG: hypothetical protein QOD73_906 [Solirubrobacteraceae bacterium]|nr:hypothetical protein [Solirubrobacteraceae bacterium]
MASRPGQTVLDRAAHAALAPLGLVRMPGRMAWLDDHGWWVVVVEFETTPARTTTLVVFADFLWHVRDRPARTVGARVRERGRLLDQDGEELSIHQEAEADVTPLAERMVARAVEELTAWREGFPSLRSWAAYLDGSAEEGSVWREYDAAVATALAGDDARARRWFDRVFDHPIRPELFAEPDPDAVAEAQRVAVSLTAQLGEPHVFRATLARRVAAARARLDLPPADLG